MDKTESILLYCFYSYRVFCTEKIQGKYRLYLMNNCNVDHEFDVRNEDYQEALNELHIKVIKKVSTYLDNIESKAKEWKEVLNA